MAQDIRLPDIGDFKDVPIIEILIAPGQSVRKEATILTLESDKATLDVPAPEDGVIGEILVKVGDKVSQGSLLATYASGERRPARRRCIACRRARGARPAAPVPTPAPARPPTSKRNPRLRRGAGRLHRRLPRRRSRAKGGARRQARDARRRLPQRRLHPLEGASACRQDHRRRGGDGGARREVRRARDRSRRGPPPGRTASSSG